MNSIVTYYKKNSAGQIDLNGSKLFIDEDDYTIKNSGKSPLLPFFEYMEGDECGQECLFVTDSVAQSILGSVYICDNNNDVVVNEDDSDDRPSENQILGVKGIDY